ncbi:MAG: hypothetical protein JXC32_09825 [Anaerolineae bacterium]|nr:hypothetical protein [Anaerolineae bacterium]
MTTQPVLLAEATIDVPIAFARTWFLELAEHPERYEFETHSGFTFTQGEFGEPGARFQTQERFGGLAKLTLRFELTDVAPRRFTFRLRRPVHHIWGYFELDPVGVEITKLRLAVGSDHQLQRTMLQTPPLRGAIQHQIEGEVAHIADSMTSLYKSKQEV